MSQDGVTFEELYLPFFLVRWARLVLSQNPDAMLPDLCHTHDRQILSCPWLWELYSTRRKCQRNPQVYPYKKKGREMIEILQRKDGGRKAKVILSESSWGWHYLKVLRMNFEYPLPIIAGKKLLPLFLQALRTRYRCWGKLYPRWWHSGESWGHRSSCDETIRAVEDFMPKVSAVSGSWSQGERSPGTYKSWDLLKGDKSCPSGISNPVLFNFDGAPSPVRLGPAGRECWLWELDVVDQSKCMKTEQLRQKALKRGQCSCRPVVLHACPMQEEPLGYGDREGGLRD